MNSSQLKFGKVINSNILIAPQTYITVNDMLIFPHGYDGFHLWEAGIALTRYLHYYQRETFAGKQVLELGTGVGITGIYLAKHTQVARVLMTDYQNEILQNAQVNALKNVVKSDRWAMLNLDWTKHADHDLQFDYIVGADLIYSGAPLEDLYKTVKKLLAPQGVFFLLVPTQRQAATLFFKIVEDDKCFLIKEELLTDPQIYQAALDDPKQSSQQYPGLAELKFYIYHLIKL